MKTILKMAALAAVLTTNLVSCSNDDEFDNTIVKGTQAALNQACIDWKMARADWENSEAFLFGAADVYSIDPHTDTWPVAANDLAQVLRDENAMANIDNFIKTANSGILGYHGLEYVLFREGQPRKIDQVTTSSIGTSAQLPKTFIMQRQRWRQLGTRVTAMPKD